MFSKPGSGPNLSNQWVRRPCCEYDQTLAFSVQYVSVC